MDSVTPIDQAHGAMQADESNVAARMGFYERLVDAEVFLLLKCEPVGDKISPSLFKVGGAEIALIFDREERLAGFAKATVPYIAMSGRAVVNLFTSQNIGLGLNLDVAPSSFVIPPNAVEWIGHMLAAKTTVQQEIPVEIYTPDDLPKTVISALTSKLVLAVKIAQQAFLMRAVYASGQNGFLLAFVDVVAGAQPALVQAISEAVAFSGYDANPIDVAFFKATDPICQKFDRSALRIDLRPPIQDSPSMAQSAPGMNPDKPPKL